MIGFVLSVAGLVCAFAMWFYGFQRGMIVGSMQGKTETYREAAATMPVSAEVREFLRDMGDAWGTEYPTTRRAVIREWLKRPSTIKREGAEQVKRLEDVGRKWVERITADANTDI